MNIFNYIYYRYYRTFTKYKRSPSIESRTVMWYLFMGFLLPFIMLVSGLFRGHYKMPQLLVAFFLIIVINNNVVKYYKTHETEIMLKYRKYKKYDKYLPMFVIGFINVLLGLVFPLFILYIIFKVILPSLDFQVVGCLYDCVDFIKWPF